MWRVMIGGGHVGGQNHALNGMWRVMIGGGHAEGLNHALNEHASRDASAQVNKSRSVSSARSCQVCLPVTTH
jgi:hypothetical protein